ncbi:DMSO reductase [Bacillus sp. B15-48]|nr:DMSO reductase [Bacillus sp. B15-48]
MFAKEWPLLIFTLLTQLAVGAYLFFVIIRSFQNKIDSKVSTKVTKRGMFFVGPVTVLALFFSIFHLGDPFGAYRSLGNIATSWLSREILFAGLFFGLWIVSYLMERRGNWNLIIGWVTSIVGLVSIFSMASIYATTVFPAWTDLNTYLAFYGTTILFGAVVSMMAILISKESSEGLTTVLKGIGLVGLAAIIVQLVYMPVFVAGLSSSGTAGLESASLLTGSLAVPTIIRWVLSIVGLVMIGYVFTKSKIQQAGFSLVYTAFALVIVGEFLGRLVFYTTGIPM